MRSLIDRFFNKDAESNTAQLAAESLLSLEYSRLDKKMLSVYLEQDAAESADLKQFIQHGLADSGDTVSLEEECLLLERYVALYVKYIDSEIAVSFDFPVKPNAYSIPAYLLFPLVQNALHHGYHVDKKYPVRIKGRALGDRLMLEVSNRVNHHLADQRQTDFIQYFQSRLVYSFKERYDLIINSNSYTFKATLMLEL